MDEEENLDDIKKNDENAPLRVLITGASGKIGYALSFMIAQGNMFGSKQRIILHLYSLPRNENLLNGLCLELEDGAFDLLEDIVYSSDPMIAFKDIDYAILCGAKPVKNKDMERKELLQINAKIFEEQGKYLDIYAKKTVKVLVVGNPVNTNTIICALNAPSISKNNFTALTRLDHNRAVSEIARKLNFKEKSKIKNVIIWGNHSSTQYPDLTYAYFQDDEMSNNVKKIKELINDNNWLNNDFVKKIQDRGTEVIIARKCSAAASAAAAICDHIYDWHFGIPGNCWTSMGVISRGEYGVPKDIIFSFPVQINKDGEWKIVDNLELSDFSKEKLRITIKELLSEKITAMMTVFNNSLINLT